MTLPDEHLLHQPIASLPLSPEFSALMGELGIQTLEELIDRPVHEMMQLPGFGYRMLKELIGLMNAHGVRHRLIE